MKPTTKLRRLKESWVKSLGSKSSGVEALKEPWISLLRFSFNGVEVEDSHTAAALGITDFATMRVESRRSSPALTLEEQQIFGLRDEISAMLQCKVRA